MVPEKFSVAQDILDAHGDLKVLGLEHKADNPICRSVWRFQSSSVKLGERWSQGRNHRIV